MDGQQVTIKPAKPNVNGPDWFATMYRFTDSHNAKVLLFKTPTGWTYEVSEKTKLHSGTAKGRSPREAAQAFCELMKLEPKA